MFERIRATVLITLRSEMVFRMNFVFLFIGLPLRTYITWLLWDFVIAGNASFSGLTRSQILLFTAFTSFLSYLYDTNTLLQIVQSKLISGRAVADLTLPMDYHTLEIYSSWGTFILYSVIGLISMTVMLLMAGITVVLDPLKVLLITSIVVANSFVQYYLVMIIGSLSIFVGTVESIKYTLFNLLQFFGGVLIPLSIFPESMRYVLYLNPMSGMIDLPASILIGSTDNSLIILRLAILLVWIILLRLLNKVVWSRSLERFTAPGE